MRKTIRNAALFLTMLTNSLAFSQINWGANAHPIQGGAYLSVTFDKQMSLLNQMGLTLYRMDLYAYDTNSQGILASAIASAQTHGIVVLPILIPNPNSYTNETAAYNAGFTLAQSYAEKFSSSGIETWELGNEYDNYALTGGTCQAGDGSKICQYNSTKYVIARGLLHGLLDGIHSGNPSALGIVDSAGWCHYAFQNQLLLDGVKFDLTGWHWYSDMGSITSTNCTAGPTNILGILKGWGKPIWLTEFNSDQTADPSAQGNWLVNTMAQWTSLASTCNIRSAFVYQLLDQIPGSSCPNNLGNCLGLADENGNILQSGLDVETRDTTAAGSVQIGGVEQRVYKCIKNNLCSWFYDFGTVTVAVNGTIITTKHTTTSTVQTSLSRRVLQLCSPKAPS